MLKYVLLCVASVVADVEIPVLSQQEIIFQAEEALPQHVDKNSSLERVQPFVSAIFCTDKAGGIGLNGTLPWLDKDGRSLVPTDGVYYQSMVMGSVSVSGYSKGACLNDPATNMAHAYLVTRSHFETAKQECTSHPRVTVLEGLGDAMLQAKQLSEGLIPVFNIGGAHVYNSVFEQRMVDYLFVTKLNQTFLADSFVDLGLLEDNYEEITVSDVHLLVGSSGHALLQKFSAQQSVVENGINVTYHLYRAKSLSQDTTTVNQRVLLV